MTANHDHNRIDLDEALQSRTPIDATWSMRKKLVVGAAAIALAAGAVSAGSWLMLSTRTPRLPKTAVEAVAMLKSDVFDKLDEERQRQYAAEAGRLMRELSPEDRQALWRDESNRAAMERLMRERFDEMARRFARGENLWGDFRERPRRPEGEEGPRPPFDRERLSEEELAKRREEFRERLNAQILENAQSGNAQESGLRAEMMKRMMNSRGGRPR